jgi:hypothetical protein
VIEAISRCAERILALLEHTREVNILHMSELVQEKGVLAYQALGWLARDKRIIYVEKGSQIYVSRSEEDAAAPLPHG